MISQIVLTAVGIIAFFPRILFADDVPWEINPLGEELCDLINDYREAHGLPRIAYSLAMMTVAAKMIDNHKWQLENDEDGYFAEECEGGQSWFDAPENEWSDCCYRGSESEHDCVTVRPREMTADWSAPYQPYTYYGYLVHLDQGNTIEEAFDQWIAIAQIRDMFLEEGSWQNQNWPAIGCAAYTPFCLYRCWFGYYPDGNPYPTFTDSPTKEPTFYPTRHTYPPSPHTPYPTTWTTSPTGNPTQKPTANPTGSPTKNPSSNPSANPTRSPTLNPSKSPTGNPTQNPSGNPSDSPTATPSRGPTSNPSKSPTGNPTKTPSSNPSANPSASPSRSPSANPSSNPTANPSKTPTGNPSRGPSVSPSRSPTSDPTGNPTNGPTKTPTANPSRSPTGNPTGNPSGNPTRGPTVMPTQYPTEILPPRFETGEPTRYTRYPTRHTYSPTRHTYSPSPAVVTESPTSRTWSPTSSPTPHTWSTTDSPTPRTWSPTNSPTPHTWSTTSSPTRHTYSPSVSPTVERSYDEEGDYFVDKINAFRLSRNRAAISISKVMITTCDLLLENFEFAVDRGFYEWDPYGCGAPLSWYDTTRETSSPDTPRSSENRDSPAAPTEGTPEGTMDSVGKGGNRNMDSNGKGGTSTGKGDSPTAGKGGTPTGKGDSPTGKGTGRRRLWEPELPYNPCCYDEDNDCPNTKPREISSDWSYPYEYSAEVAVVANRYLGYTLDEAIDLYCEEFSNILLRRTWKAIGCGIDWDLGIYVCYFGSAVDMNSNMNPYGSQTSNPTAVPTLPPSTPVHETWNSRGEEFTNRINSYCIGRGVAAIAISQALMSTCNALIDNYQWAFTAGIFEWKPDGCGAPYSWYDENGADPGYSYHPCCWDRDIQCPYDKPLEITASWRYPYTGAVTIIAAQYRYDFDECVEHFLNDYGQYLVNSRDSWNAIACGVNLNAGVFVCYLGSSVDQNSYSHNHVIAGAW